jgi:hypothetical protein
MLPIDTGRSLSSGRAESADPGAGVTKGGPLIIRTFALADDHSSKLHVNAIPVNWGRIGKPLRRSGAPAARLRATR